MIRTPLLGIVSNQSGSHANQVVFGERKGLCMLVVEERKQTDCRGREEEKGQDNE